MEWTEHRDRAASRCLPRALRSNGIDVDVDGDDRRTTAERDREIPVPPMTMSNDVAHTEDREVL